MTAPESPTISHPLTILQQLMRTYYDISNGFERYMGVSRARWQILAALLREGEMSQTALAQQIRVDGAAITRQVKLLEDEGWIRRWASPQDNRFTLVTLTPLGQERALELLSRRDRFEQIITRDLDPQELESMRHCLAQMRANLQTQMVLPTVED